LPQLADIQEKHSPDSMFRIRGQASQCIQQWAEKFFIIPPAFHRRLVDRLAHLRHTGGMYRAFALVETDACLVPIQAAKIDYASRLGFLVCDNIFISDIKESPGWQHFAPMLHQIDIIDIIPPKFRQIVSLVLPVTAEQLRVAGKTGINRTAIDVNDLRVRQHHVYQANSTEICGNLVGDVPCIRRTSMNPGDVIPPLRRQVSAGRVQACYAEKSRLFLQYRIA